MGEGAQFFLQLLVSGIAVGSIYALVALGFVIIYKATGILNFAQGEIMMVGAYFCFSLVVGLKLPFLLSFLLTLAFSSLLGVLVHYSVLRPMIGEPIFAVVMITIGLAILLRSLTAIIWGTAYQSFPPSFSEEPISMGPLVLSHIHLWSILVSVLFLVVLFLFFKYSRMGVAMRATAQNHDFASLMGVSVQKIFALSWAISMIVSSVAGVFLAHINLLNLNLSYIGLRAFPAVILGGIDSIPGAILGGIIIGVVESLAGGYLDAIIGGVKEVTAFAVLLLILMIKPYGLFGTEEIERV